MSNRFFIDNFCNKTVPPVGCLSQVYTEKLMICSCQWIECCLDISLSLSLCLLAVVFQKSVMVDFGVAAVVVVSVLAF